MFSVTRMTPVLVIVFAFELGTAFRVGTRKRNEIQADWPHNGGRFGGPTMMPMDPRWQRQPGLLRPLDPGMFGGMPGGMPPQFGGGMPPQFGGHFGGKVPSGKPGESFPNGTIFSGQQPKHLGAGQFGDVWEAVDDSTQEKVAVKIFYAKDRSGKNKQFLTWNTADEHYKEEMRKNIKECKLIQEFTRQGQQMAAPGAARICRCKEEYISQGQTNKDAVMYTVWEMCGRNMYSKVRADMAALTPTKRLAVARKLTEQVLEGLAFLAMFHPPLIHHDLKADNAVVLGDIDDIDSLEVKLIDFGCYVQGSLENKRTQSLGDPHYMPPEFSASKAFENALTFDTYGVGLIHMELICPALKYEDWCPYVRNLKRGIRPSPWSPQEPVKMDLVKAGIQYRCKDVVGHGSASQDLDFIAELLNKDAIRRPTAEGALGHTIFQDMPKSPKSALIFSIRDRIEYKTTKDGWVPGVVTAVNVDTGSYALTLDNGEARLGADPARVRASPSSELVGSIDPSLRMPVVDLAFKVNDEVEYYSERQEKWFDCLIAAVNGPRNEMVQGTYDLKWPAEDRANSPNQVFKVSVVPERLRARHLPRDTKVMVYGRIPGVIVSYDRDREIYTIKSTDYPYGIMNIGRDFVAVRSGSE